MLNRTKVERNLPKLFWMNLLRSMYTLTPVITLFYLHRGLTYQQMFILSALFSLGAFLFEVPTGLIADRIGRKKSILIGLGLLALHELGFVFAEGFWQIAIAFMIFVIGYTFLSGIDEALIYDSLKFCRKTKTMKREYGRYLSGDKIPALILPLLAAFIAKDLANWQFQLLIITSLVSLLIALIIGFTLKEPPVKTKDLSMSSFQRLSLSLQLFRQNTYFRQIFFNSLFVHVPAYIFWRIWQPYLTELSLAVIGLGIIVSVENSLTLLLQRRINHLEEKYGLERVILITAIMPFIGYLLLIFSKNLILAIIGVLLVFVFAESRRPLISDYLNGHIESQNRATSLSLLNMLRGIVEGLILLVVAYFSGFDKFIGLPIAAGLSLIGLIFFRIRHHHLAKREA